MAAAREDPGILNAWARGLPPPGLDLATFAAFEERALAGHDPMRDTGVRIYYQGKP